MATVDRIIKRAFRKIGVSAEDEALTSDQMATGLEVLNDLLWGLAARGANIGHVEVTAGREMALDDRFNEGIVHMLAGRLAPEYGTGVAFDADEFFRQIQSYYAQIPDMDVRILTRTPSQRRWSGEF
jgi:hypothetical protein